MEGTLLDSKIRCDFDALRPRAEPFDKYKVDDRADEGASLIVISLPSLGLWAVIWGTVASLAAVL
jgi:hypothetical protein